jgi:hypothetical protein
MLGMGRTVQNVFQTAADRQHNPSQLKRPGLPYRFDDPAKLSCGGGMSHPPARRFRIYATHKPSAVTGA